MFDIQNDFARCMETIAKHPLGLRSGSKKRLWLTFFDPVDSVIRVVPDGDRRFAMGLVISSIESLYFESRRWARTQHGISDAPIQHDLS